MEEIGKMVVKVSLLVVVIIQMAIGRVTQDEQIVDEKIVEDL